MRLAFILLFALSAMAQEVSFINPSPSGPDSQYADNPSFEYGERLNIQWTPTSESISLVMYQQTQSAEFEYLFQNRRNLSSFPWNFETTKDLTVSRIFFFQLFITGDTAPAATSHYFNITGDANSAASSTSLAPVSSSLTSSPSSTNLATTTPALTSTIDNAATTASSDSVAQEPTDDGLSTGAKIGLGIGVSLGTIALALLAWFIYVYRKKKTSNDADTHHPHHRPTLHMSHEQKPLYPYQDAFPRGPSELHATHNVRAPAELPSYHDR